MLTSITGHDSVLLRADDPLLHFTFVPAAAAPQFDGFREMTFTDPVSYTHLGWHLI